MKPMFALHKDASGSIICAGSFSYDYELSQFMRGLDIRPGDRIEFGETLKRDAAGPEPQPEFLTEDVEPAPTSPNAVVADELQPF